jgi:hypothetical protein
VVKDGKEKGGFRLLMSPWTESHSELEIIHKLRDGARLTYAKVEFSPPDLMTADKVETYKLKIDEERTPDWFDDEMKERVTAKVSAYIKTIIVTGDVQLLIGGQFIIAAGAKVECANNMVINALIGGTVNDIRGGTVNYIRGGTVNYIRGGTVNYIRGGTVNDIRGGTVNDIRGGTVNYIRGGTVNYIRGGTVNDIRGGTVNDIRGGTVNDIRGGTVNYIRGGTVNDIRGGTVNDIRGGTIKTVQNIWDLVIKTISKSVKILDDKR